MNPYSGANFFSFFSTLLVRIGELIQGKGRDGSLELASDEIQLLTLSLLSISCALIGTFLVVRKMAMFANALSHTCLFGIAIAYLLLWTWPVVLIAALFSGFITAFLVEFLQKISIKKEVSIGFVFTTIFAAGIFLISLFAKNVHLGVELVMGNSDALHREDVAMAFYITLATTVFIFLFLKELKLTSFDPLFSKIVGISPTIFHYLLALFSALIIISAFRCMGVFMVLAFLTGPPLIARRFTHSLKKLLFYSLLIALFLSVTGVALSRHFFTQLGVGLSTGGLIVTLLFFTYFLSFGIGFLKVMKKRLQ